MCAEAKKVEKTTRKCAVCGSFYPSNKEKLHTEVQEALSYAKSFPPQTIRALVVPHAGYIYSADVAATAYKTLHKKYKNVFIIGSSHHVNSDGVSLYSLGDYETPLGRVKVNAEIVHTLINKNSFITYNKSAHIKEHTIEVQLPFLQTIYGKELQIVPILMATSNLQTIQKMAEVLQPYFNEENLFVISTDLSHFPSYKDAHKVDKNILNAVQSAQPQKLLQALLKNEKSNTPNLQTSACGWSSLLTLLYLTQNAEVQYEILEYKNSGDTQYGDKSRVVGYGAMRIYDVKSRPFTLNLSEKKELKEIAKLAIYEAVLHNKRLEINADKLPIKLQEKLGAFVTIKVDDKLKGCIGRFEPDAPLYKVVIEMAISASRFDTRFTPLNAADLKGMKLEISVLTKRKKIASKQEIVLGRDGIYVVNGAKNGTYLPHVATETGWSVEEFVHSCCVDKAGMNEQECQNAELYTYEAIVF